MGTGPLQFSERLAIELERLLQVTSFHVCIAQQANEFHIVRAILSDLVQVGQHLIQQRADADQLVVSATCRTQVAQLYPAARQAEQRVVIGRVGAQAGQEGLYIHRRLRWSGGTWLAAHQLLGRWDDRLGLGSQRWWRWGRCSEGNDLGGEYWLDRFFFDQRGFWHKLLGWPFFVL